MITTAEDYIWFRLAYMYGHGDEPMLMHQDLNDLQLSVCEWGPERFDAYPLLYLQVLLLTHQFERAVDYFRSPSLQSDQFQEGSEPEAVTNCS